MTTTSIQTIEDDRGFWVRIDMDGGELTPHGPFRTNDEAEAAAARIAGVCHVLLHSGGHMPVARRRAR